MTSFKQAHLLFCTFLEYLLLFLDDNVGVESKQFSNSKSSASGCRLSFAWFFCQFQPDVDYKSVAYKKKRVTRNTFFYVFLF